VETCRPRVGSTSHAAHQTGSCLPGSGRAAPCSAWWYFFATLTTRRRLAATIRSLARRPQASLRLKHGLAQAQGGPLRWLGGPGASGSILDNLHLFKAYQI